MKYADFKQHLPYKQGCKEAVGYTSNSYILGAGDRTVYIYDRNVKAPLATFPLKGF